MQENPKAKTAFGVVEGRLLSKAEVLELLGGVAYTTLYNWMCEGKFQPRSN